MIRILWENRYSVIVDAGGLEEFLNNCYKYERYKGRGGEYEKAIFETCRQEMIEHRMVTIGKWESVFCKQTYWHIGLAENAAGEFYKASGSNNDGINIPESMGDWTKFPQ